MLSLKNSVGYERKFKNFGRPCKHIKIPFTSNNEPLVMRKGKCAKVNCSQLLLSVQCAYDRPDLRICKNKFKKVMCSFGELIMHSLISGKQISVVVSVSSSFSTILQVKRAPASFSKSVFAMVKRRVHPEIDVL